MGLSAALGVATSGLSVTAERTAVASRNINRANEPGATRKTANVSTIDGGGVRLNSISVASSPALYSKMLTASALAGGQKAVAEALTRLDATVNDPDSENTPAALVGKLTSALQQYAASPSNSAAGAAAVAAADALARGLQDGTASVQQVRRDADAAIAADVSTINDLLAKFELSNNAIVVGTRLGRDVTDDIDTRAQLVTQISSMMGVRTVVDGDNSMSLYTDSGLTLFETTARKLTFSPSPSLGAGQSGNDVYLDGVPITGSGSTMALQSGEIAGLAEVRDGAAVIYQSQLDEIARGLVEAFAESDQSGAGFPDVPGLFTYAGATGVPATGTLVDGLAGRIMVAASVDPTQGGNPALLRDGAISGDPAYSYNATGAASFVDRLNALLGQMGGARSFDATAQAGNNVSLVDFASNSVSWLQEARKVASTESDYRATVHQQASDALSKETGVNLDDQMAQMLELERAYQATAKLISVVDAMMATLIESVR